MKFRLTREEKSHHTISRLARVLSCDGRGIPRLKRSVRSLAGSKRMNGSKD